MKQASHNDLTRRAFLKGGAIAAASAGLTLAGCRASANAPTSRSTSGERENATASSPAASDEPQPKVLAGTCAHASDNFNPIGLSGGTALGMSATRHVFEGLYDLDMRTYAPYAALAAGEPRMISDTECEVGLRRDALFSDGSVVTAGDVANAFEKNRANGTIGPMLEFIDAVTPASETTVRFTLRHPFDGLLQARLSLVKVFPANREAELATAPIGSGPWAYVAGKTDGRHSISFAPNPHYNGPLPAQADSMVWTVAEKADERVSALRDESVQVSEDIAPHTADQAERAGATVAYTQGFAQPFLMFNTLKEPFSDKHVRQAFFYAIDAERLVAETAGGHGAPLTGFLPASHPNYHRASTVYAHNPQRAKALLALAGLETLEFTLTVNDNWVADLAPLVQDDLKACGIECRVKTQAVRWNELADNGRVLPYDVVLAAGDPSCFGNDPDLLMSWWYGDNVWTRGRSCWARSGDASFTDLQQALQAARETAGDERQRLWNRCFDIIADAVPLYGLFHREFATGWQPDRIAGFKPIATSGLDFLGCSPR